MINLRTLFGIVLVLVVIAIGAGSTLLWRWNERNIAVNAGVPELPVVTRWPAEFEKLLLEASADVETSPDPLASLGRLAGIYHVNGFADQASHILRVLRKLDRTNARWAYLQSDSAMRREDEKGAGEELSETVLLDDSYAPAWIKLGQLRAKEGALDEARRCFTRAVQLRPDDIWPRFELIAFEARYGHRGDPRQRMLELAQNFPDVQQVQQLLSELHEAGGDRAGAVRAKRLAENAQRQIPTLDPWVDELVHDCYDPNRLSVIGIKFGREGRLGEAAMLFERAVRFNPADPALWQSLSDFYRSMDRVNDAVAVLENAIRACPSKVSLMVRLAQLYSLAGRADEARKTIGQAMLRWPNDASVHMANGFLLRDAQRYPEAIASFQESVRRDPESVESQFNIGWCLLQLGNLAEGRAEVEKALQMRSDYPDALMTLGNLAVQANNVAEAVRFAGQFYEQKPNDPRAQRLYSTAQLLKAREAATAGKFAVAEGAVKEGLSAEPNFAPLHRVGAQLQLKQGHGAEAVRFMNQYVQLVPQDPDGFFQLAEVYQQMGNAAMAERARTEGERLAHLADTTGTR